MPCISQYSQIPIRMVFGFGNIQDQESQFLLHLLDPMGTIKINGDYLGVYSVAWEGELR